ncbi:MULTISPECIES: hypothetical protein [Bartonella]|nr:MULTISPECIES: hypothetical protein [Bartonella]
MKLAHRELSRKEYGGKVYSGKEYSVCAFLMAKIFGFPEYFMKA